MRRFIHATIALLLGLLLSGCGGGAGDDPGASANPLSVAQKSTAEPTGPIAEVKARALNAGVARVAGVVDATVLFDWAEQEFPDLFPKGPKNQVFGSYLFRYYPQNSLYLAVEGDTVLALLAGTGNPFVPLGHLADYTCAIFPEVCQPPVAVAGTAQSVKTGQSVQLDGSQSRGASGDTLTFAWTLTVKPLGSQSVLNLGASAKPNFTPDLPGVYSLKLVVGNGRLSSEPVELLVTAAIANAVPIAVAGPDRAVTKGTVVALDGTASSDTDRDALSYSWSLLARPSGSLAALSNPSSSRPSFTADATGEYKISLTVSDGKATSQPSIVNVTAVVTNVAPVAVTGATQSVTAGSFVFLNGSGSYDPNGDPISYQWSLFSRPAGSTAALSSTTSQTPNFLVDVAGTYGVSLVVSDGKLSSPVASMTITATGASVTPGRTCCRVCSAGKACGDSCISASKTCSAGAGCAC